MDKILSWNIRGLNNKIKQRAVKKFIDSHHFCLVGLLENRIKINKLGDLYLNMFQGWGFTSNSAWHKGGRIIMAWNTLEIEVDIRICTSQFIHSKVKLLSNNKEFFVTFVYAFNKEDERRSLWVDLCS